MLKIFLTLVIYNNIGLFISVNPHHNSADMVSSPVAFTKLNTHVELIANPLLRWHEKKKKNWLNNFYYKLPLLLFSRIIVDGLFMEFFFFLI